MTTERIPPHDEGAERALLGLMLRTWSIAADVTETLTADAFYRPGHGLVFEAIGALLEDGRAVDPVTVSSYLGEHGHLEVIGGETKLVELVAAGGLSTSVPAYVETIRNHYGRRKMLAAASEAVAAIYEGDGDRALSMLDRALDAGAGAGSTSRTFVPVPLGDMMRGDPVPPSFITPWLYKGGLTVFQAEPAVGKSWLALWQAAQVMRSGGTVLYFDEEGGSELVSDRLRTLGIDPGLVDERFHFFPHESRSWDAPDVAALGAYMRRLIEEGHRVDLAVLDSLPDFLSSAGLDENSNTDVTTFVRTVAGAFHRLDCATLVLDHLKKPEGRGGTTTRSKYSRGAGAKLAKADATIRIETLREFDRNTSGALSVWRTKDRRGGLSLPRIGNRPRVLEVKVTGGGLGMVISEVDDLEGSKIERNAELPTGLMESLSVWAATNLRDQGLSQSKVYEGAPGARKETVKKALDALVEHGYLRCERGQRNAKLYRFEKLYRQTDVLDEPEFLEDGSPAEMF